ncbi:hypothetical protein ABER61_21670 [Brevibacillus formosus]|uniref:Ig-like domain-containing protein n=1 Tax=Brevibacillus formosus TaxID=54913 RepID=A0A837KJF4_9BACL|nr:hypothetical protein [Brevibacillus formosus]KLH97161.1 hypothetical protein AA984_21610 [Brevibacillus formosus]MED1957770.1 hypothetical protein [Brevibacillus formosus]PSJ94002.1 hypothetical protein C7R91_18480 [Brevibacillus formosus]GED58861.1 hypothetical protein BFO01nite_29930 [Brevibacillus formosus]
MLLKRLKKTTLMLASLMVIASHVPAVSSAGTKVTATASNQGNNRPYVKILTPPSNKSESPTIYFNEQPKIQWFQSDPDNNTVFKTFWVLVYDKNFNNIYSSTVLPQNTSNTTNSFEIPVTLPRNQTLYIAVSVQDESGNWSWTDDGMHFMYIQTP